MSNPSTPSSSPPTSSPKKAPPPTSFLDQNALFKHYEYVTLGKVFEIEQAAEVGGKKEKKSSGKKADL